ncbi:amidohydrolase family protein [Candidatus Amarobacter glycogenicus]|uniref:amidohydrolase family protein n=1 Tax=Candidatus Amarobacter glycogenicus TaxID=3140699 RepID=UPI0031CC9321
MNMQERLAAARDVRLTWCCAMRLINVFSGAIEETDIVIAGENVVGFGGGYPAREVHDLDGAFVAPGLVDAHVHIESSLCTVPQFARAVVPRGTTTVVTDPHEIANVLGLDGIRYMLETAKYGPLTVYVNVPSCVPATHMETTGAHLEAEDIADLRHNPWVLGLAGGDELSRRHQRRRRRAGKTGCVSWPAGGWTRPGVTAANSTPMPAPASARIMSVPRWMKRWRSCAGHGHFHPRGHQCPQPADAAAAHYPCHQPAHLLLHG